jgi:hypothetical protein
LWGGWLKAYRKGTSDCDEAEAVRCTLWILKLAGYIKKGGGKAKRRGKEQE